MDNLGYIPSGWEFNGDVLVPLVSTPVRIRSEEALRREFGRSEECVDGIPKNHPHALRMYSGFATVSVMGDTIIHHRTRNAVRLILRDLRDKHGTPFDSDLVGRVYSTHVIEPLAISAGEIFAQLVYTHRQLAVTPR